MKKRLGFVGILLEDRKRSGEAVNAILAQHADCILARVGIPRVRDNLSVITLVIDAETDETGRLTGRLGALPGVSVKSGLAKGRAE